jgi:hypothetical protein
LKTDSDSKEESERAGAAALAIQNVGNGSSANETETSVVVSDVGVGETSTANRAGERYSKEERNRSSRTGEIRLFFVLVDIAGNEGGKKYELPASLLEGDRLLELFKKFPNGHYRVYLEQDRTVRKLYDLHIYDHKLTTPDLAEPESAERAAMLKRETRDGSSAESRGTNGSAEDCVGRSFRAASAGPELAANLQRGVEFKNGVWDESPCDSSRSGAAVVFFSRLRRSNVVATSEIERGVAATREARIRLDSVGLLYRLRNGMSFPNCGAESGNDPVDATSESPDHRSS